MCELKTLKDFKCDTDIGEVYDGETMRLEAIKWIKADKSHYYSKQGKEETILWIKNFFNITEEELK